ncbi:hypothetical protein ACIGW8_22325 [Streptomyces sioyaensis]|uniref:hypothetical protein n=1 Tax=Streptomyces sioyaensis TaxID=67364 RepID=UPI0037D350B8
MSTYEPLSPDIRAALAELLGGAQSARTDFLLRLGHTVQDCRTHEHGLGEDLFCGNLYGWMGERMALVLRRLLDAEAELERRPDRAEVLSEAADVADNDDTCDCGGCVPCVRRQIAAELRCMADAAWKDGRATEGVPATSPAPALSCERCLGDDANRYVKNGGPITGCPACGLDRDGACAACRHTHDAGAVCGTPIATGGMYARRCQCTGIAVGKDTPAGGESTRDDAETCGRCRLLFDPADTRFDGRARYRETPFCRGCVDACHESTDACHRCPVCTAGGEPHA